MWPHHDIVCLVLCLQLIGPCLTTYTADDGLPPPEMARKHGYRCDVHNITTEDGYILQTHRLPGGKLHPLNCSLPPVIVMHGIFCSSADFFLSGPSEGLAYLLADVGYDVWLPNSRGNTYSREHVTLSTDDNRYWNFSWHEIGIYDLPSIIDYVLQTTGHQSILYIGASMGTTAFFVMCSERPEYNAKVQYMVALAPVAYLNYITSVAMLMTPVKDVLDKQLEEHSHGEMFGRSSSLVTSIVHLCKQRLNKIFCDFTLFQIVGSNPFGTNLELTQNIYAYTPAGGSAKSMLHFGQLINTNYFRHFDYGSEGKNIAAYGSPIPPSYDLSLITVPMGFFYGDNDAVSDPKDVIHLVSELKDVEVYRENVTSFNHLDFVLAKDVKTLVYDKLISLLQTNQRLSDRTVCVT